MADGAEATENRLPLLDQILTGFSVAEVAAEEVVDLILDEGGRQLYQAYIERKSFAFASDAFSKLLISELEMCFVRHDEGELAEEPSLLVPAVQMDMPRTSVSPPPALPEDVEEPTEAPPAADVPDVPLAASPDEAPAPETDEVLEAPLSPEPAFGHVWSLEAEPQRCRIDTWARACVPVRRKLVRPKSRAVDDQKKKLGRAPKLSTQSVSSRSPSRMLQHIASQMATEAPESAAKAPTVRPQMIPLTEPVEHDEEESALRDMKDREAKRRRDEENRLQRKAADEAEEAARLAQVKDQMKNKPYTYDSEGNIIWVQALQAEKLPSASPAPNYTLRRENTAADDGPRDRKAQARHRGDKKPAKAKVPKDPEFVDTFKKFASQQPAMIEAMTLSPGVQLSERGATKRGEELKSGNQEKRLMTRRDYEELVQTGKNTGYPEAPVAPGSTAPTPGNATPAAEPGSAAVSAAPSKVGSVRELPPASGMDAAEATGAMDVNSARGSVNLGAVDLSRGEVSGSMKVVRSTDLAVVPHPPVSARPEQPMPPPSARRVQMKRDALGYTLSTRERIPTGTGSRFPNCAAAPPLGATMGHGLLPQGQKHEEYYFPTSGAAPGFGGSDYGEDVGSIAPSGVPSVLPSPRSLTEKPNRSVEQTERQGQIVSKNPELVKRLFQR